MDRIHPPPCGKLGHLQKVCRSAKGHEGGKTVNGVAVDAATITEEQPLLRIEVSSQAGSTTR